MRKLILRIGLIAGLLSFGAADPRFAFAEPRTSYFQTSSQVATSTSMVNPTLLLAPTNNDVDVCISFFWSGSGTFPNGEFLALDSDTTVSTNTTSGNFRIPPALSSADVFCLHNYVGPIYAVVGGTNVVQNVSVLRKK